MTGTLYRMWDGYKMNYDFTQVMHCLLMQMAFEMKVPRALRYDYLGDGFEFYAQTPFVDTSGKAIYEGDIIEQLLDWSHGHAEFWYAEVRMVRGAWCLCEVGFDYDGTGEDPRQNMVIDMGKDTPDPMLVVGNIKEAFKRRI